MPQTGVSLTNVQTDGPVTISGVGLTAREVQELTKAAAVGAVGPLTDKIIDLSQRLGVAQGAALAVLRSLGHDDIPIERLPDMLVVAATQIAEAQTKVEARAAELATQLGVTREVVISFFRIIGEAGVQPEDMPSRLFEIAGRYKKLLAQVQARPGDDLTVARLKAEAQDALERGDPERAKAALIQLHSCFISYSSKDEDFARRLHSDLQANGVRCWFAPEDMKIGAKILDTIDDAIRARDKVLLILSEASLRSEWVEDEVTKAFAEERDRKQTVLYPIRLDDLVLAAEEAWARKLRDNRHIGDFRGWKEHGAYQKALERLLRDLRVETV